MPEAPYWEDFEPGSSADIGSHMGLVRSRREAVNPRGETVMTMEGWGMFRRGIRRAERPRARTPEERETACAMGRRRSAKLGRV
jgi:hypothetical protein